MNLLVYLAQGQRVDASSPLHAKLREPLTRQDLEQAAKAVMLSFLLTSGGARKHSLVFDEAIHELTLWDRPDKIPLHLGTRASHILQCMQDAFGQDQRIRLPAPNPSGGEIFFYHALYLRVQTNKHLRHFASALRRASPLTRLCTCPIIDEHPLAPCTDELQGRSALTQEESEAVFKHPATTFLLGYLADQWSTIDAPQPSTLCAIQVERLLARCATLLQGLHTCVRLGQIAKMSAFPLLLQRLLQRHYLDKAQAALQLSQWRMADRELLLQAYIALLGLGSALDEHFQREVVQPGAYGWRAPLETRIFVRSFGRLWSTGGLSAQIAEAQRMLRGQMG